MIYNKEITDLNNFIEQKGSELNQFDQSSLKINLRLHIYLYLLKALTYKASIILKSVAGRAFNL